jgi:hypothetical protein
MDIDFSAVSAAYDAAARATIYLVDVGSHEAEELALLDRHFWRAGQGDHESVAWETRNVLSSVRWRMLLDILPLDRPEMGLLAAASHLDGLAEKMGKATEDASRASEAANLLRNLSAMANPLAGSVLELLRDSPEPERLLVLSSRLAAETTEYLANLEVPTGVVQEAAVRKLAVLPSIIAVGPPRFFGAAFRTAARANSVCFVQYGFEHKDVEPGGIFGDDGQLQTPPVRFSGLGRLNLQLEPFDLDEAQRASADRIAASHVDGHGEPVDAMLIILHDGYAVWTETDDRNWMQCVDESKQRPAIVHRKASELQPGDVLVLRVDGAEPDFIRAVADSEFGAGPLRVVQDQWKAALRRQIDNAGGFERAARDLNRLGAVSANFRYWTTKRCISPRRQEDFFAVATYTGTLPQVARDQWVALQKIHSAHNRAGTYVRGELVSKLLSAGTAELDSTGHQSYEIPKCGQLDAFRVRLVTDKVRAVPASSIDRPFMVRESLWH